MVESSQTQQYQQLLCLAPISQANVNLDSHIGQTQTCRLTIVVKKTNTSKYKKIIRPLYRFA